MIETHPYGDFVPEKAKYLIVGSFPGKLVDTGNDWFYSAKRNQFWKIMESVFDVSLPDKKTRKKFMTDRGFAMTDIIKSCRRLNESNLDINLKDIKWNKKGIEKILAENEIEKVFFTSKFVENKFKRLFKDLIKDNPQVKLISLPSPSPRYANLDLEEKISIYKDKLLSK